VPSASPCYWVASLTQPRWTQIALLVETSTFTRTKKNQIIIIVVSNWWCWCGVGGRWSQKSTSSVRATQWSLSSKVHILTHHPFKLLTYTLDSTACRVKLCASS
jgi:hypothetical protein